MDDITATLSLHQLGHAMVTAIYFNSPNNEQGICIDHYYDIMNSDGTPHTHCPYVKDSDTYVWTYHVLVPANLEYNIVSLFLEVV